MRPLKNSEGRGRLGPPGEHACDYNTDVDMLGLFSWDIDEVSGTIERVSDVLWGKEKPESHYNAISALQEYKNTVIERTEAEAPGDKRCA